MKAKKIFSQFSLSLSLSLSFSRSLSPIPFLSFSSFLSLSPSFFFPQRRIDEEIEEEVGEEGCDCRLSQLLYLSFVSLLFSL